MIKSRETMAADLHDIDVLREFDPDEPSEELAPLGFDFESGTFKARRIG